MAQFDFNKSMTKHRLMEFAEYLKDYQQNIDFKVSRRGWCYQLESEGIIHKGQFDKVEKAFDRAIKRGLLPVDFVADEEGRQFSGVERPDALTPSEFFGNVLSNLFHCEGWYTPDWWDDESYYIQMVVEKIDLKTLFRPICQRYHIPIATSKGWSSKLQRAKYTRRFQQAEERGLQAILLYCGDHDPDGLRISDFIRKNLTDVKDIIWSDGTPGYDPRHLMIERFGLNADFIERYELTWIDNLITGSGKNLANPRHPNHSMPYVQNYIHEYGTRKCEANAIVPLPDAARELVESTILRYLGAEAKMRFAQKRLHVNQQLAQFRQRLGFSPFVQNVLDAILENYPEETRREITHVIKRLLPQHQGSSYLYKYEYKGTDEVAFVFLTQEGEIVADTDGYYWTVSENTVNDMIRLKILTELESGVYRLNPKSGYVHLVQGEN